MAAFNDDIGAENIADAITIPMLGQTYCVIIAPTDDMTTTVVFPRFPETLNTSRANLRPLSLRKEGLKV